ncbi:MAG: VOC family protein [Cognatishimia sp.]
MSLGAFSVSLSVKDLQKSMQFYKVLGFETFHDTTEHGFVILKNGTTVIGLFQEMFDGNILTFNPGWDQSAEPLEDFEDIRDLQARLKVEGLTISDPTDPEGTGPANFTLTDPDGNAILFDQHVERPT